MVTVDLKAAFIASRSALKHMGDGGRIVFVRATSPTSLRWRRQASTAWSKPVSTVSRKAWPAILVRGESR
jgi:NAD(P)-dependent dehydrogenase (short-subunit alcohol dehydrogenase family)